MSDKKYLVPEGMLKAAQSAGVQADGFRAYNLAVCLEAAIRWLAENPVVPTDAQAQAMIRVESKATGHSWDMIKAPGSEWQRICFLAPEPEVPDAVKDLMVFRDQYIPIDLKIEITAADVNQRILEAHRIGKSGK
jgi:hypothetical protein